ncbi:hypothetical protein LshimejAT787_0600510 [Lyophyllum shimeji]|uniref:DNA breaking-rejoining enzyme n=1 Tax=Lyophyllum shimeji TaxID=47721 RepID=A0A9P3UL61_LYOSH|nr:hypothetical protein LshimejAT787_0600510 [Lyophyllum shimeji]
MSARPPAPPFTHDMSLARTIQPTNHPAAHSHQRASSSQPHRFPNPSGTSSLTLTQISADLSYVLFEKARHRNLSLNPTAPTPTEEGPRSTTNSSDAVKNSLGKRKAGKNRDRFDASLPEGSESRTRPTPYSSSLTPALSPLRPHCLARDRLRLWKPAYTRPNIDNLGRQNTVTTEDVERINQLIINAWTPKTLESYGAGLLVYHVFCNRKDIPEEQRAPASQVLMASFVSSIAGAYAGQSVSNYLYGVRAWHILHGVPWSINEPEMEALLKAADKVAPSTSKRKKRRPYTPDFITAVQRHLDLNDPLDAAVDACLSTTFYTAARLGEFTVPRLDAFWPEEHIKPSDVRHETDRNGLKSTVFHIPRTKTQPIEGEDVSWSAQHGPTDPERSLNNHLKVNEPPANGHLFAYKYKNTHRPLTKPKFLQRLAKAARDADLDPLQGHGIRIGATLEYLRGIPFDVVKVKGRWSSDAFILYLTKHAQILAPYMQAIPEVHETFMHLTMPRLIR